MSYAQKTVTVCSDRPGFTSSSGMCVRTRMMKAIRIKYDIENDPSAGSPTETLLRLLLPLDDQVWASSRPHGRSQQPV